MKKLFSILSVLLLIAMITVQCKKDKKVVVQEPDEPKPTAGFEYVVPDSTKFLEYQFSSSSSNYKEILWQFGDDSTSVDTAPFHTYAFPGIYFVTLTTRNGQNYSASKQIRLNIVDPTFDATKVGPNYIKTVGGVFTVSRDNGGGPNSNEGSLKVIDEDRETKFFQSGFANDLVMKIALDTPKVAGAYTLTSANDSRDRDPSMWVFQGSEDDVRWIELHKVITPQWTDDQRKFRKIYHFNNKGLVAYKYYRIRITRNNGSRDFQLADWTVNQKQPNK
ncbi:hypothetical protein GCM10023149_00250 [Mucilaginibacter gynuensis]|uniref:PKD domain-containing protein n=1 Tax=Mucilaginibacter gynuensis TaxID=1302236 RepID=A0ABP8FM15_9SPHI